VTYYGAKNLADGFRTVRKNTITIAEDVPEASYAYRAAPEVMTIAQMLAHLAIAPMWQIDVHSQGVAQFEFAMFAAGMQRAKAEEAALQTKAAIVQALRANGERFAAFLEGLDEATLASVVSFPPPVQPATKSRFEMLLGVKEHEMHHRGQLMLLQRLIGQVPHLTRARQQMQAQAAGHRA
jgi:uncharacterized damage-inducible protein DinB